MKRLRITKIETNGSGTIYKVCPECKKMKPEEVGLTAGDGQRWYCTERCLNAGERMYRGKRG
jgi:hypothetical protein